LFILEISASSTRKEDYCGFVLTHFWYGGIRGFATLLVDGGHNAGKAAQRRGIRVSKNQHNGFFRA